MQVDISKISFEDFESVFGAEEVTKLVGQLKAEPFMDLWQLTIADLSCMFHGELPKRVADKMSKSMPTSIYVGRLRYFREFCETFTSSMEEFSIPPTAEGRQASVGLPTFNENEGLLVFARSYFGLKSFTDAEYVTLADVFLAKKDQYITAMYERRLNDIQQRKFKMRQK